MKSDLSNCEVKQNSNISNKIKEFLTAPMQNAVKRVIFGTIMLNVFILLIIRDEFYSVILISIIGLGMCYELISIVEKTSNRPFCISKMLVCYFTIIRFSMKAFPAQIQFYPVLRGSCIAYDFKSICFYNYVEYIMLHTANSIFSIQQFW